MEPGGTDGSQFQIESLQAYLKQKVNSRLCCVLYHIYTSLKDYYAYVIGYIPHGRGAHNK